MPTGTVKWFDADRRFGFIEPDGGDTDVFVHITAVKECGLAGLHQGQRIRYEVGQDSAGRTCALDLELLDP